MEIPAVFNSFSHVRPDQINRARFAFINFPNVLKLLFYPTSLSAIILLLIERSIPSGKPV